MWSIVSSNTSDLQNRTGSSNSLFDDPVLKPIVGHLRKLDHPKLCICKQIILLGFRNRFRMLPICSIGKSYIRFYYMPELVFRYLVFFRLLAL